MFARFATASLLMLASLSLASAEPVPTVTVHGKIEKAEKDSVVIQPRDESGKFGKAVTLTITGTSHIMLLTTQTRAGEVHFVQKQVESTTLKPGQAVAVIYATPPKGKEPVVLSAIVQAEAEKK